MPSPPENLLLEEFPDPNPYFPLPPRPESRQYRRLRLFCTFGWILLTPLGVGILWLGETGHLTWLGPILTAIVAISLLVSGIFSFFVGRLAYSPWRTGRIRPALVVDVKPGRPPRWFDAFFNVPFALVSYFLLLGYVPGSEPSAVLKQESVLCLRYLVGDRVREARVRYPREVPGYAVGDVIWIAIGRGGLSRRLLGFEAHPDFRSVPVPASVREATQDRLKS